MTTVALRSGRRPAFDVIVPIHNSFHVGRFCLSSLERTSSPEEVQITCVLDACDRHTIEAVKRWSKSRPNSRVLELDHNSGFVGACNAGLALATAEMVVLLNSDACVNEHWTELFSACFASDEAIGIAAKVAKRDPIYPEITTCEGFCYAMRRKALDEIGFLDGIFGKGYCEESDLSMRANYFGWKTVLLDNCYVFHFGRESFGTEVRQTQYDKNKRVFFNRWGKRYGPDFEAMKERDVIGSIRSSLANQSKFQPVKWV
jgi:GT2 family glycosyltransferase